jgi:hypothetical protein
MRLKVDENLPRETCDLLDRAGRDAIGVGQQGLAGADDARVYRLCQDERRALVTLDVDFANVHAYDPKSSAGVIVLRGQTAGARRGRWVAEAPVGDAIGHEERALPSDRHQDIGQAPPAWFGRLGGDPVIVKASIRAEAAKGLTRALRAPAAPAAPAPAPRLDHGPTGGHRPRAGCKEH